MHSQLDLITMSILFLGVYYLRKFKILLAALFFGLACATKLHVLVILPIAFISF
jgi:Gpi18-like mannosyltransferase